MWSDRPSGTKQARLRAQLSTILPPPREGTKPAHVHLRGTARPEQVAEILRPEPGFVWLDGGTGPTAKGHRLAANPLATISVREGRATVCGPNGKRVRFAANAFDLLSAVFSSWGGIGGALLGYFGYELGGEIEQLPHAPADDLAVPDLHLGLYSEVLVWDESGWSLDTTDAWQEMSPNQTPAFAAETLLARAEGVERERPASQPTRKTSVTSHPDRHHYERSVAQAVARIASGEIFQVNLCRRLEAPLPRREIWPFYQRLRAASPASRGAFFDLGRGRAVLSISPEVFLTVRDRTIETRPIKGTRPRGRDRETDRALLDELLASEKDRAELAMIVDVARNDLGRVAKIGSITVPSLAETMTLPTVFHTAATVRGVLRAEVGTADLLRATFPAASITGAPKIQAMAVIAQTETRRRGPAMGAFGWLSLGDGERADLDLAVAIRTAVAARGRVAYTAGCGITADSDPLAEREESEAKAAAFLAALGGEETE